MYFARRGGVYVDCAGHSFRDFMAGKLAPLPGELPTLADWEEHLSTIFPEVRLKRFLEMRGSDSGPWDSLCAMPAFWVGLLYDDQALDAAWELVKDWTPAHREAMRRSAPALGLKAAAPGGRLLQDFAKDVLKIAQGGLKRRAKLGASGDDETGFLHDLFEIADSGMTPADRLLDLYHGEWNKDLTKVFTARAY